MVVNPHRNCFNTYWRINHCRIQQHYLFLNLPHVLILKTFFKTYKYALIIGLQGSILSYLFHNKIFLFIGIGICILAFVFKSFRMALTLFEESVSKIVSKVINGILLSIVYLIILLPIGILKKVFSHKKGDNSFILLNKTYTKADLENPW